MKQKINIEDYIRTTRDGTTVIVEIVASAVYSNSSIFNNFIFAKNFKGAKNVEVIVPSDLEFDSFLYLMLNEMYKYCERHGINIEPKIENEKFESFYHFLVTKEPQPLLKEKTNALVELFESFGNKAKELKKNLFYLIEFVGEVIKRFVLSPFNLKQIRWSDLPTQLIKVGVNSVGICLLIVFLIGIIIGYVGAIQLARFGFGSFLASLVGIAVTRELSPIMVGIVIAGRSGSAFAAEIGTMKVSEEVDALTAFGFDKYYFLVFPRLLATIISIPLIVSICNIAGIFGGFIAGKYVLGLTLPEFQHDLLDSSISYFDVIIGVAKSIIFGAVISIIGCFKGLQVQGGAESVGKYTTSSVVTSILFIIIIDAIIAFMI